MGGGFRSIRPMSALERDEGKTRHRAVPEREAARQFAIMSVRVRGLVPTFPPSHLPTFPHGSQAVVEPKTKVSLLPKRTKPAKGAPTTSVEGGGTVTTTRGGD
jgi:hypothetical protein